MDMRSRGKGILGALLLSSLFALGVSASAAEQSFPTKPVRLIVPNQPGGAVDILARLLQNPLQQAWKQPVLVEYKPGAGTVLGTDFVAKSNPDGHTIGIVVTSHVINPGLRKKMPFDTVKDLSGVTMIAVSHILISATPSLPANTVRELIALAKKEPGKLSYASPGSGSSMHLAMELLKKSAGIDLLHVPFKGSAGAYPEVMEGRIHVLVDPLFSSLSYIQSKRLKPIAIASPKRAPNAPDIPVVAETLSGFNVQSVFGAVVPSATPKPIVRKLNADVVAALKTPEIRKRMSEVGLEPVGNSPEEFDAFIRAEIPKWAKVVEEANITAD
jgi:tripartite-type tricarboxylate transporter receptor subunit TctC